MSNGSGKKHEQTVLDICNFIIFNTDLSNQLSNKIQTIQIQMLKILGALQKMLLAVGRGPRIWVQILFGWAVEEENVDLRAFQRNQFPQIPQISNQKGRHLSFFLQFAVAFC